jgi:hypothetical protein
MDLERINEIKNPPMIRIDGKDLVKGYCEIYSPQMPESKKKKGSQKFDGGYVEYGFPNLENGS